jgi:hypothetical protein
MEGMSHTNMKDSTSDTPTCTANLVTDLSSMAVMVAAVVV